MVFIYSHSQLKLTYQRWNFETKNKQADIISKIDGPKMRGPTENIPTIPQFNLTNGFRDEILLN